MENNYVQKIKNQYETKQQTKIDELKQLDKKVKKPARVFAYVFGTIGALVLGGGMCLAMKVIGDMMIAGIGIGLVGIGMVSCNYSMYKAVLDIRKSKYANQIFELTDEIENGNN